VNDVPGMQIDQPTRHVTELYAPKLLWANVWKSGINTHNTNPIEVRMLVQKIASITIWHILHNDEGAIISMIGAKKGYKGKASTSHPKMKTTWKKRTKHIGMSQRRPYLLGGNQFGEC
jgi:hypothetical protein